MTEIKMTDQTFHEAMQQTEKPVLVEFWAPWCVYCRRIAPAMEKVVAQYEDKVQIGQVNIDDFPALAEAEEIELVPTFCLYQNGKRVASMVAPGSKAAIDSFLAEHCNL